jgi:hypothetical protein
LISPATGKSVAQSWAAERALLTPLPETAPAAFDIAVTRPVGKDCLVAFEGRRYSVPFQHVGQRVEVRGCAGTVEIYKDCRRIAVHPRRTDRRLLIKEEHFEGPAAARVTPPPPLGKMGAKIMELAAQPVPRRSIDYYVALMEVAR